MTFAMLSHHISNRLSYLSLFSVITLVFLFGICESYRCSADRWHLDHGRLLSVQQVSFNGQPWKSRIKLARWITVDANTEKTSDVSVSPSTARYLAVQALLEGSGPSALERLSNTNSGIDRLTTRDRAFSRVLVTTVERRIGQIDAVLGLCQTNEKAPKSPRRKKRNATEKVIDAALRVGAVQLLFLNIPSHAAVKETVDVLRMNHPQLREKLPEAKVKYVNAVLRRIAREGKTMLNQHTTIHMNASLWLINELEASWGKDITYRILESAMEETPRCLTVSGYRPQTQAPKLNLKVQSVARSFPGGEILPQGSVRVSKPPPGSVSSWPGYLEGSWWLQDLSATIPALALYSELSQGGTKSVSDTAVVDLCAAPGGKTAQLSNFGFSPVTAVELSSRRCKRLEENMERLKLNWNIVVADGTEWTPSHKVSGVLVDVPCTATGTASKRPDVLRRDANYTDLLQTQYKLACHVADNILEIGGVMIYSTCSVLKSESEDQVAKILNKVGGSKLEMKPFLKGEIPGCDESIDENGCIRLIPGVHSEKLGKCDGFFVARLIRIS